MNDYMKTIADNISKFRKLKGLTQEALAQKLGVSFQAVSKWENSQSCPDVLLLPVRCDILGISADELFGRDENSALPWADDGIIRGVVFSGHRIISGSNNQSEITFRVEGNAMDIIGYCGVECNGGVHGDVKAGAGVSCGNVGGDVKGQRIQCSAIVGNVDCSSDIIYQ